MPKGKKSGLEGEGLFEQMQWKMGRVYNTALEKWQKLPTNFPVEQAAYNGAKDRYEIHMSDAKLRDWEFRQANFPKYGKDPRGKGMMSSPMGYSVKAKKKVEIQDPVLMTAKNGRRMIKGTCPLTGCGVCVFVKNDVEGDGIWSGLVGMVKPLIKPALDKAKEAAIEAAKKKAAELAGALAGKAVTALGDKAIEKVKGKGKKIRGGSITDGDNVAQDQDLVELADTVTRLTRPQWFQMYLMTALRANDALDREGASAERSELVLMELARLFALFEDQNVTQQRADNLLQQALQVGRQQGSGTGKGKAKGRK